LITETNVQFLRHHKPPILLESPQWFIKEVKNILATVVITPGPSPLAFEASDRAALHNQAILQSYNNDISKLLDDHQSLILKYGSEFRPIDVLEPLLLHHYHWPKLRRLLSEGSNWSLHDLDDKSRKQKNLEFIARGNHKSALKHEDKISEIFLKEISQGWMIPFSIQFINEIKKSEIAPIGLAEQWQPNPDQLNTD
jgi:hypothetical protein